MHNNATNEHNNAGGVCVTTHIWNKIPNKGILALSRPISKRNLRFTSRRGHDTFQKGYTSCMPTDDELHIEDMSLKIPQKHFELKRVGPSCAFLTVLPNRSYYLSFLAMFTTFPILQRGDRLGGCSIQNWGAYTLSQPMGLPYRLQAEDTPLGI